MWFSIRSDASFVKKNRSGNAGRLEWGKTWPAEWGLESAG